jgi:hypothetical protein
MLDLALAGDMDLGTAADIATNISTPFGIRGDEKAIGGDFVP